MTFKLRKYSKSLKPRLLWSSLSFKPFKDYSHCFSLPQSLYNNSYAKCSRDLKAIFVKICSFGMLDAGCITSTNLLLNELKREDKIIFSDLIIFFNFSWLEVFIAVKIMFVSKFLLKFNQSFQGFKIWGYFSSRHGQSISVRAVL